MESTKEWNGISFILISLIIHSSSALSTNKLECNIAESVFIKSNHEINNKNETFHEELNDQNEEACFSKCHFNQVCQSAQYDDSNRICLMRDFSTTNVSTKIKPSSNKKVFYKQRCNATHKFITLVNNVVDCKDIYNKGWRKNGIYGIPINVTSNLYQPILCEMSLQGGGWTVIQQRVDGSVDFNKNWQSYKNGFGQLDGNFWYGNDRIHKLTWFSSNEIIIPSTTSNGIQYFPRHEEFKVASEAEKYQLTIGAYLDGFEGVVSLNLQDFTHHNGQYFTTTDKDNDNSLNSNCADKYKSGWWYNSCHYVSLNGIYSENTVRGIVWRRIFGTASLQKVQMMVRRK